MMGDEGERQTEDGAYAELARPVFVQFDEQENFPCVKEGVEGERQGTDKRQPVFRGYLFATYQRVERRYVFFVPFGGSPNQIENIFHE